MGMFSQWRHLSSAILYSNLLYLIAPILSHYLLPIFSYENSLLLPSSNLLYSSISFDGIHFLTNQYLYEKNYAFLPGFTLWVKFLSSWLSPVMCVLVIVLVNKVATALGGIVLMNLAKEMTKNSKVAKLSAVLFLFNPASIFYHVVYSQAVYSLIVFAGIYEVLKAQKKDNGRLGLSEYLGLYGRSLVLLGGSTVFRTTGMFFSLIYGIPLIQRLFGEILKVRISRAFKTVALGCIVLSFFVAFQVYYSVKGYNQFCGGSSERPDFCNQRIPNIYSYIQDKFWQVGFLKYFHPERTFFILIGLPSVVVSLLTLTNSGDFGLDLSYWILLFVTICYSNLQSSARFFSSHPLYAIGLARALIIRGKATWLQRGIVGYFILYNWLGIIMFPARFPWT